MASAVLTPLGIRAAGASRAARAPDEVHTSSGRSRVAVRRVWKASARVERLRAEVEQAMSEGRLPTREELVAVLGAFFRDLLEVGERRRSAHRAPPAGPVSSAGARLW
jgi:hypothetical protein